MDSCNHKTLIETQIPRNRCAEHGVKQQAVPWAENNSRFTAEFKRVVLLWLKDDSIKTVAQNFALSWDETSGIMQRGVKHGLALRQKATVKHIGIDETSYKKCHDYITVIVDKEQDIVLDVLLDRKSETLERWFENGDSCALSELESVSMDMWEAYIKAVKESFACWKDLICFDRFHILAYFGKALNKVRSQEHREFVKQNKKSALKGTKYQWQKSSGRTDNRSSKRRKFLALSQLTLKTAKAWRIKETATVLWDYTNMGVARKHWEALLRWISHSRLQPVIKVGQMVKRHLWGILNAIRLKKNNSMLEAKNARIQRIKKTVCGFRNKERFKQAILFHLGGLDVMPTLSSSTQ